MKPEIEDMIQALQGEKVSFYQAKVVIDSIEELSADEKREALRRFIPADKVPPPAPTNDVSPPAPTVSITPDILDMIQDLKKEGVTYFQARTIISGTEGLTKEASSTEFMGEVWLRKVAKCVI